MAVLLVFSWQNFILQTHVHKLGGDVAVAPGSAAPALLPVGTGHRHETPASCPVCREMAHAGHFTLPTPVVLRLPVVAGNWCSFDLPEAWARASRSHAWRSRGPPAPATI